MATDYSKRLGDLQARRNEAGPSVLAKSYTFSENSAIADQVASSYARKTKSKNFLYALVSMQEVDSRYTEISYREADRVAKQLDHGLMREGTLVTVELQGSLPLNVHLRRVSDVDMLVWRWGFSVAESHANSTAVDPGVFGTTVYEILTLRNKSHTVLTRAFPAAKVDDSGGKCITMSEGSLLRNIDVVPCVLYESHHYQDYRQNEDRGVRVFDKKTREIITNFPFKVRAHINAKDDRTGGGCKKAIRLLKNMREDAAEPIALSSFNIMSLVHAMDDYSLVHSSYQEGKIVGSLQQWFYKLDNNERFLRSLDSTDGSRKTIQSDADVLAVKQMSAELNLLMLRIAQELQPDIPANFDAWRSKVEHEYVI